MKAQASVVIYIPTRYIHSHASIIHKEDIENTIKLLVLLVQKLDDKKVEDILLN
ncbi:MAG: hypothetical protein ACQKHC_02215 [Candidatus Phytoplasma pruni]|uniref:hypothetical protein n=1 Tax=Milkweed yellows phytoplasma TaxID=208434 RepID=UPI0021C3082C|nr:hypothetical protein [Milkweed yellows phytoplasma]